MKEIISVLAILSVAILLVVNNCGGGRQQSPPVSEILESTIVVQNAPFGHQLAVIVSSVNTAPTTVQQFIDAMQSGVGAGSGSSPVRVIWPHSGGFYTGLRLVIVASTVGGGQHRFALTTIQNNGNAIINWNAMNYLFELPID
jgi:hypothetical protein